MFQKSVYTVTYRWALRDPRPYCHLLKMGRVETLFFSLVFTFKKKYKLRRGVSVCGPEVCAMSGPHCRRMRHHGPFGPGFEDVTATPIKPAAISSTLLYTSLSMFFRAELAF